MFTVWYHTLFTHPAMNRNIALRIWDIFIMEHMDFAIILKVSYLIFIRHKGTLMSMDFIEMVDFCKSPKCFEFDGDDDHQLILRARRLQLNELFLKPIRNLKYVLVEEKKSGDSEKKDEHRSSAHKKTGGDESSMWAFFKS